MEYSIDLLPIYECTCCKATIDKKDIVVTLHINSCPVCGCDNLILLKID